MAADNRDWYRDLLRKRTNYVERSRFRRPAIDPEVERVFGSPNSEYVKRSPGVKRAAESSFWWLFLFGLAGVLLFGLLVMVLFKVFAH